MFWRLLGAFGILLVAAVGLLGLVLDRRAEDRELQQIRDTLHTRALLIQKNLRVLQGKKRHEEIQTLAALGTRPVRITLLDKDFKPMADPAEDYRRPENHKGRRELEAASRGEVGTDIRRSASIDQPLMYLALPVDRSGTPAAYVRVALSLDQVEEQLAG